MWVRPISRLAKGAAASATLLLRSAGRASRVSGLSLSVLLVAGGAWAQQSSSWRNYVHELGWQIEYPANVFSSEPGPSGLGKEYRSADESAKLVIFSAIRTAESYRDFQGNLLREPRFRGAKLTEGDGWFTLSGGLGQTRYFAKYVYDDKRYFARAFLVEYDQRQSVAYELLIGRMSKNFSYEGSNWESEADRRNKAASRAQSIANAASNAQETDWQLYENTSAGWSLHYPANLLYPAPVTGNAGIRIFRSTDDASELIVTGGPMRLSGLQDYLDQLISHGRHEYLEQATVTGNQISLSGTRGRRSYFEKYLFSSDLTGVQSIALEYPSDQAEMYSGIVAKLDTEFSAYRVLPDQGAQFQSPTDRINAVTVDQGQWQGGNGDGEGVLTLMVSNGTDGVLNALQVDPYRTGLWRAAALSAPIFPGESGQVTVAVVLGNDGKPAETTHRPDDRFKWWDNMHRDVVLSPFERKAEFKKEVGLWLFGN